MTETGALVSVALAWTAWGTLHSLLITPRVRTAAARRLRERDRWFRLGYNIVSAVTLIAALVWTRRVGGPVVFDWWGAWVPVSGVLLVAAGSLFVLPARSYDLGVFLGTRAPADRGLHAGGGFRGDGIHGVVRHPWYLAALLVLWVGERTSAGVVMSGVLSLYVVVGAHLEERKLLAEFGDAYRSYRERVPMFVPGWRRGRG